MSVCAVCAEPISFYYLGVFFEFNKQNMAPKDSELVSKWKENLGDDVQISGTICINHFDRKYIVPASAKRLARLKKGAVPMRTVNVVEPTLPDAIVCSSSDGSDKDEFYEIDDVKSHRAKIPNSLQDMGRKVKKTRFFQHFHQKLTWM